MNTIDITTAQADAFTPGPWAWENYKGTVHVFLDNEGGTPSVCRMVGLDQEANARLISASPDLYTMAQHLESWWRFPNDQRTIAAIEPVIIEALEAIDKARRATA